jgi:protein O-GlcNAc transferase
MTPSVRLTMIDGVHVVVPDSHELITPYVLREQQDWFEDEIKFLRRLLQPGQQVIDIGANYGVYTLSLARAVGPTGQVWAFEPASATADLLAAGISANGFTQVTLERCALSSAEGAGRLSIGRHSELNALLQSGAAEQAAETVRLDSLDHCLEVRGWREIDLVKIDAEGEESNILKGGSNFFSRLSPLVQYEVMAGDQLHMELVRTFAALGYDSYRLVPGLGLLIPFAADSKPDDYLLNLFACKPDRAARLAAAGVLLTEAAPAPTVAPPKATSRWARFKDRFGPKALDDNDWRQALGRLPYGKALAPLWERTVAAGRSGAIEKALRHYSLSRDASLPASKRFEELEASLAILKALCKTDPSHLRLASLARVARDYGARNLAANALSRLSDRMFAEHQIDLGEPFLAPGERHDSVDPAGDAGNWILSAVLEEFERIGSFSSFYTGPGARRRLEMIRDLGFGGPEMQRRLDLLQRRFGAAGR